MSQPSPRTPYAERYLLESDNLRRRQLRSALLHGSTGVWRERRRVWPAVLLGVVAVAAIMAVIAVHHAFLNQREIADEERRRRQPAPTTTAAPARTPLRAAHPNGVQMGYDFLDVEPETVDSAGRAVLGTVDGWQAWATRAEERMRVVPELVRDGRVAAAWQTFAGDAIQADHALAGMVECLGTNTRAGAAAVVDTDCDAASALTQPAGEVAGLNDRINATGGTGIVRYR